jgi:nucleotide-binding universal stress UspA family protein
MSGQGCHLILVPLDGSRAATPALESARVLADMTRAEVQALHVSPRKLPLDELRAVLGMPPDFISELTLNQAVGEPEREIPRVASVLGAGLLVMATHGRTDDVARTAGHVTLSVLQRAPCPVLVIRSALGEGGPAKLSRLERLLVPLDGSPEAAACISQAADLARRNDAELCFLHVATAARAVPRGRAVLSGPRYLDQPYLEMESWGEEFLTCCLDFEKQVLAGVLSRLFLDCGEPAGEIVRFAKERACGLIVAAWGGRLRGDRAKVVKALLERARSCSCVALRAWRARYHTTGLSLP